MYLIKGTTKAGRRVKRFSYVLSLEDAARELLRLCEGVGWDVPRVEAALGAQLESCLAAEAPNGDEVRARLFALLRMRDMLRFIVRDPQLETLRRDVLRMLLAEPDLERRWAEIRGLLLEQATTWALPSTDKTGRRSGRLPVDAGAAGVAAHEVLSRRNSGIGQILLAVALFNFDRDEETPPPNLVIRFAGTGFPLHRWEHAASPGMRPVKADAEHWVAANPLCRWEFLACDLAAALRATRQDRAVAGQPAPEQAGTNGRSGTRQASAGHVAAADAAAPSASAEAQVDTRAAAPHASASAAHGELVSTTCNLQLDPTDALQQAQLELLQFDAQTFFAALQRKVHRELGSEGVRLHIALLAHLAAASPGASLSLNATALVAAPAGAVAARKRVRLLERLLALLSQLEVQRVYKEGDHFRLETAPLLTLLGRWNEFPATSPLALAKTHLAGDPLHESVRLLADHLLGGDGAEAPAARLYKDVPESLLGLPSTEHPLALGVYLYLRAQWRQDPAPVVRSSRRLIEDAGYWLKPSTQFRMVEALNGDLHWLREQGFIGPWRCERHAPRNALQDNYRVEPPAHLRVSPLPLGDRPAQAGSRQAGVG